MFCMHCMRVYDSMYSMWTSTEMPSPMGFTHIRIRIRVLLVAAIAILMRC